MNKLKMLIAASAITAAVSLTPATVEAHGGSYWGPHYGNTVANGGPFYCTGGYTAQPPAGSNGDTCNYGHQHNSGKCWVFVNTWRWGGSAGGGTYVGNYVC